MAAAAENPGTVIGFSRLFGVDPGIAQKRKYKGTYSMQCDTLKLDTPQGLLCFVHGYKNCII